MLNDKYNAYFHELIRTRGLPDDKYLAPKGKYFFYLISVSSLLLFTFDSDKGKIIKSKGMDDAGAGGGVLPVAWQHLSAEMWMVCAMRLYGLT